MGPFNAASADVGEAMQRANKDRDVIFSLDLYATYQWCLDNAVDFKISRTGVINIGGPVPLDQVLDTIIARVDCVASCRNRRRWQIWFTRKYLDYKIVRVIVNRNIRFIF